MKNDMNDWQLGSGAAAIATKLHYFNTDFDLEDMCWSPAASTKALSNRTPWSWRRTFQTEYYTPTLLTKSELFSFNFRKFYLGPAKNVEMGSRH